MKIFGYGTFITSGIYQNFENVRAAYLPGYLRVLRPTDPFPYVLKDDSNTPPKGFWGLVFEVTPDQLVDLDYYEGSLYERIQVECMYNDRRKEFITIYYPTKRSIKYYKLTEYIVDFDPWQEKIKTDHPEIVEEFPELVWDHPPNNH